MVRSHPARAVFHRCLSFATLQRVKCALTRSTTGLLFLLLSGFAAATVGTSPASFNVGSGGEASFSVPIIVPPGTAGMQPDLALVYNSQAPNGVAGMGMELAGLSTITRCPRIQAIDSARGSINLDTNDRFCLDGQRLMVIAGTYGADGAEYRTELDTFSKVISYGTAGTGPSYFKIWTKAGQIVEYGNTTDSRILAAFKTTALTWAQNKVSDAKGNYLTVTYGNHNSGGEYYPTRVDYTGNAAAGIAPYASVRFTYIARGDVESAYVAGSLVRTSVRLTDIDTYYGASKVKAYNLSYQVGATTGRSRLTSVQECDGSATPNCLPATLFGWSTEANGTTASIQSSTPVATGNYGATASGWKTMTMADVNGDGKADAVWLNGSQSGNTGTRVLVSLSTGNGFFQTSQLSTPVSTGNYGDAAAGWKTMTMADVNADGEADAVWLYGSVSSNTGTKVAVSLSNGNGTFQALQVSTPTATGNYGSDTAGWKSMTMADVNGDGRADAVWLFGSTNTNTGAKVLVSLSNGNGTFQAAQSSTANATGNFGDEANGWMAMEMADVNGDGLADAVWLSHATTVAGTLASVSLSMGNGLFAPMQSSSLNGSASENFGDVAGGWKTMTLADVNGDGKADALWIYSSVSANLGTKIAVALSKGNGTFLTPMKASAPIASGNYGNTTAGWKAPIMADVNGDGKADAVWLYGAISSDSGTRVAVSLSNGDGTFKPLVTSTPAGTGYYGIDSIGWRTMTMADVSGDGKADAVWLFGAVSSNTGTRVAVSRANAGELFLTSITNGLGAVTNITYKPLTDPSVYVKDTNAVYPNMDVQTPMYVVATVTATNGVGGNATTSYDYGGLKVSHSGRSLGFRWTDVVDGDAGIAIHTDFSQGFPTMGMATKVEQTRLSTGATMSETTHTLGFTALGFSRYMPFVSRTVDNRHELSGTLVTTKTTSQTLDTYGSPLTVTVTNVGGGATWTSLTTNTYSNNATSWVLGLLTQSTVKNTQPDTTNATRTSSFVYNTSGQLTTETVQPGTPALTQVSTYTYDAFGNRTGVTVSGSGITSRTSSVTWSSNGRFPSSTTNALGHVETSLHHLFFGGRTSGTDANGLVTLWSYDSFGRKVGETRPSGATSNLSYASCGTCPASGSYIVTTTTSGAPTTKDYYDKLQRLLRSETQGFGGTAIYQDTQYNSLGKSTKLSRPYYAGSTIYWETTAYDAIGRATSVTDPDGGVTSISYNGLATTVTNTLGQAKITTVNALGQTKTVTEPAGAVNYSYDPFGNLLSTTDALNNKILVSFDLRGFKTAQTDPDLGTWTFVNNVLGQVTSQTDAKGQVTTYTYDKLGRMTQRVQPGQTDTWVFDTATKGKGKLASSSTNNGFSRTHSYDSYGRPSSVSTTVDSNFSNMAVSTVYDSSDRVTRVTYPTGFSVTNYYNSWGHLAEVRNTGNAALYWQANTRNADGALTRSTLGNGLNTNYTYQANNGNLTRVYTGATNGTGIQDQSFGYDLGDNLTSRSDARTGVVEGFSYDNMNRLTQSRVTAPVVVTKNYTYNAIGNLMSKSDTGNYTYHATKKHAVASIAGAINTSFSYDANGNMLTGNGRTLTWNSWNMIASNSTAGGSFAYDANHVRTRMITADNAKTYYLDPRWDAGINFEKEIFGNGQVEYRHSIYAGGGAPVALYTTGPVPSTRYFHNDHLGSLTAITNESGGLVQRRSYDPHGRLRNTNGSDATTTITLTSTPHAFTGHETLDNPWATNSSGASLINMNGRIYDPQIGRFMSADPYVQSPDSTQSYNRYSYVNNNPLSLTDPSGYFSLRKAFKSIGRFASKMFKNPVVRVAIVVAASIATGGAASGAYGSYAAAAGSSAFTIGGSVAITSGVVGGAAGGFVAGGLMGGNLKSAALGAVTGAIGGGVGGYFGNNYSLTRVASETVTGGINARIQGDSFVSGLTRAAAFSLLTYGTWAMRQPQIEQSKLNPLNANGESVGFMGDNFSLFGERHEYINGVQQPCGFFCQGRPDAGSRGGKYFGFGPHSVAARVGEAVAGPHDFMRDVGGFYDEMGNAVLSTTPLNRLYGSVHNYATMVVAAPFGLAGLVQTEAPAVIYLSGRE